ncbi:hypothetical protein [Sphingobium psychrophilum]|uniref:hypothetical protein n=1 Tax=Sphingobium psychrophilum TaxID=2728834 RepID=UPI00146A99E3|nr:hypothetical protein [Sphingobium psychrophilum]
MTSLRITPSALRAIMPGFFGPDLNGERGVLLADIEPRLFPPTADIVGTGSIMIAHTQSNYRQCRRKPIDLVLIRSP